MILTALIGVASTLVLLDVLRVRRRWSHPIPAVLAALAISAFVGACVLTEDWGSPAILALGLAAQLLSPRCGTGWLTREVSHGMILALAGGGVYLVLGALVLEFLPRRPSWLGPGIWVLPVLAQLLLLLLVEEIVVYWIHRLDHRIPWLWKIHRLHHAPKQLNLFVTDRDHPWFSLVRCPTMLFILWGAGAELQVMFYASVIRGTINATNHWDVNVFRLGSQPRWWQLIVSTPSYHAWHHTIHCRPGANLAELFPVVDALFGTLEWPRGDPRTWRFGLTPEDELPHDLLSQLLEPFYPLTAPSSHTEGTAVAREPSADPDRSPSH